MPIFEEFIQEPRELDFSFWGQPLGFTRRSKAVKEPKYYIPIQRHDTWLTCDSEFYFYFLGVHEIISGIFVNTGELTGAVVEERLERFYALRASDADAVLDPQPEYFRSIHELRS